MSNCVGKIYCFLIKSQRYKPVDVKSIKEIHYNFQGEFLWETLIHRALSYVQHWPQKIKINFVETQTITHQFKSVCFQILGQFWLNLAAIFCFKFQSQSIEKIFCQSNVTKPQPHSHDDADLQRFECLTYEFMSWRRLVCLFSSCKLCFLTKFSGA